MQPLEEQVDYFLFLSCQWGKMQTQETCAAEGSGNTAQTPRAAALILQDHSGVITTGKINRCGTTTWNVPSLSEGRGNPAPHNSSKNTCADRQGHGKQDYSSTHI